MLRPFLRGAKISAFLLGATLVSTFIVIQSPRPTHAEGLLYGVTCVVKGLLSRGCPKTTAPTSPTPTPTSPSSPTPETPAPTNSTPQTQVQQPVTTEPIVVDQATLERLESVQPLTTSSAGAATSQGSVTAFAVPTIRSGTNNQGVLGVKTVRALEATEQGWRIFGALWYWWVIIFATVFGLWIGLQRVFLKTPT